MGIEGLAEGVDAAAHRAAIDAGGRTVAVSAMESEVDALLSDLEGSTL